jgi:hypothetical protein
MINPIAVNPTKMDVGTLLIKIRLSTQKVIVIKRMIKDK